MYAPSGDLSGAAEPNKEGRNALGIRGILALRDFPGTDRKPPRLFSAFWPLRARQRREAASLRLVAPRTGKKGAKGLARTIHRWRRWRGAAFAALHHAVTAKARLHRCLPGAAAQ